MNLKVWKKVLQYDYMKIVCSWHHDMTKVLQYDYDIKIVCSWLHDMTKRCFPGTCTQHTCANYDCMTAVHLFIYLLLPPSVSPHKTKRLIVPQTISLTVLKGLIVPQTIK